MSLCYGSAANMFSRIQVSAFCNEDVSVIDRNFNGPHWGIDVSGWALIILGSSLMVQNILSCWTLVQMLFRRRGTLLTWSLDPVVNAIYMILSGSNKYPSAGQSPIESTRGVENARQSLHKQVFRARVFIRFIWAMFAIMFLAVAIALYFAVANSSFSPKELKRHGDNWLFWGRTSILLGKGSGTTDWAGKCFCHEVIRKPANVKPGPLVQSGMQGLIALAMHCADVVIDTKNDETSWQEAYARYAETPNAFIPRRYKIRWLTILLFLAKTLVQWVFSFAISVNVILAVALLPLIVATVIMLFIAILLEVVARRTPRGGAPTTYGEFSVLFEYITRYHLVWL
jgi:hypothetical protein